MLGSITFSIKPSLSLDEFIILLQLVTQKTNNFTQDVTVGVNKQAKKELQQPKQITMASAAEMKALFDGAFGEHGSKLRDKGSARIEDFYGRDDEDPIRWLKDFEKVAKRYKWDNAENRIAIAGTYMKDAAADWFDERMTGVTHWETGEGAGNNTNFTDRFKTQFCNDARTNNWYHDLVNLKQQSDKSVDEYATKFKRLANRVNLTNDP